MLLCIRLNTVGICHFNPSLEAIGMSRRLWTMGSVSRGSRNAVTCWRVYKMIDLLTRSGIRFSVCFKGKLWSLILFSQVMGGRMERPLLQKQISTVWRRWRLWWLQEESGKFPLCIHSNVEGFVKHSPGSLFNKNILLLSVSVSLGISGKLIEVLSSPCGELVFFEMACVVSRVVYSLACPL